MHQLISQDVEPIEQDRQDPHRIVFAQGVIDGYGPSATDLVNDEVRGAMIDGDAERACFWMLVRARVAIAEKSTHHAAG